MRRPHEDPPLPIGYYEDPKRRCTFTLESISSDVKGLSFAVLLRAVEDGCNPEWLQELAKFYEIDLPEGLLNRQPNLRVKMNQRISEFVPIHTTQVVRAPLLEWGDVIRPLRQ